MGHGPIHMSAVDGRPRGKTAQAKPILQKMDTEYKSTCLNAELILHNVSDDNLDWIKCQLGSIEGVTSVKAAGKKRHILNVRAKGGPETAKGIKSAVWHMLASLG